MTMPTTFKGQGKLYTLYLSGRPILFGTSKEISKYLGITENNFRVIHHRKKVYKGVYKIKEGVPNGTD